MSEVLQAPELASPEKVAESTAMVNDANSLHALAVFVITVYAVLHSIPLQP